MLCKEAIFDSDKFCISNRGLSRILSPKSVRFEKMQFYSIDKILGSILSLKGLFVLGRLSWFGCGIKQIDQTF